MTRAQQAGLIVELIALSEELEWAARLAGGPFAGPLSEVPEPAQYLMDSPTILDGESNIIALRRFIGLYAEEIRIVRAARNRVAHALTIDDSALGTAVEVARALVKLLRRSFGVDDSGAPGAGELTVLQRAALDTAATEHDWSSDDVTALVNLYRVIQMSTTRSRKLETASDWELLAALLERTNRSSA